MSDLERLSAIIGYRFSDPALLALAVTHRSASGNKNNERLEFLGDSALNFIIGQALFNKFQEGAEGELTRLRASLVKQSTLAAIGCDLKLGQYLRLGPGEKKSGGFNRDSILEDAVEAIAGAIYLDAGFETCQRVVSQWFESRLERLSLDDNVKDNKTRLQEHLQSFKLALPQYRVASTEGDPHRQTFHVECLIEGTGEIFSGSGGSRQQAEQVAAGVALEGLLNEQGNS